jgi:hypothetical protein
MLDRRSLPLLVLVLAAAFVAALASPQPAAAAKPCWVELIDDWYDGRIDRTYEVHCYREAIRRLPADVDMYSSAREDIERALLAAMSESDDPLGPHDLVPPPDEDDLRELAAGGGNGDAGSGDGPTAAAPIAQTDLGPLDYLRPSNADEIPLPLLVLAGMAMLLLAAAGTSVLARRVHARRVSTTAPDERP